MRRLLAGALLVPVLAGCGGPVFVPEAGPNAPGYRRITPPPAPRVELRGPADYEQLPAGGVIDTAAEVDGRLTITGWALVDAREPRGTLELVLPAGARSRARVEDVVVAARPDVVAATGEQDRLWTGFTITVETSSPPQDGVCVLSHSSLGDFRLGGSDETLCPS